MGEEIRYTRFSKADYKRYHQRLTAETARLREWFESGHFRDPQTIAGYELEAWLIDNDSQPCPHNETFLSRCDNPLLTAELARFNIELNVEPQCLTSSVLSDFETSLASVWADSQQTASGLGCHLLGIGILPTLQDAHLTMDNLSTLERYRALNEQVMRQRKGESIKLAITGEDTLESSHRDVMLEAASTSLQIHIQTPVDHAVAYYNSSLLVSAPMVAIAANSPTLFGKSLWHETRIPVFEQSVPTGGFEAAARGPVQRVGFGSGFAKRSLYETFAENLEHFPILLPVDYESLPDEMRHVRLHNGTIWRWNRPLIGFNDGMTDNPHIRIEHRVAAAAPSLQDNIANIAFYYGLAHFYACYSDPVADQIDFAKVKDNFYLAAQRGIDAHVEWVDGRRYTLRKLILDTLLIEAETGLHKLDIDEADVQHYLGIIADRINSKQTGSMWQKQFLQKHDHDHRLMTRCYYRNQQMNTPVHEWDFASC